MCYKRTKMYFYPRFTQSLQNLIIDLFVRSGLKLWYGRRKPPFTRYNSTSKCSSVADGRRHVVVLPLHLSPVPPSWCGAVIKLVCQWPRSSPSLDSNPGQTQLGWDPLLMATPPVILGWDRQTLVSSWGTSSTANWAKSCYSYNHMDNPADEPTVRAPDVSSGDVLPPVVLEETSHFGYISINCTWNCSYLQQRHHERWRVSCVILHWAAPADGE